MKEYPMQPAARILGILFAASLIISGIYLVNLGLQMNGASGQGPMFVMAALALSLGIWLLVGVTRLSVTVDGEAVRVRGGLGKRVLPLSDIDGYRYGNKGSFYLVRKNGKNFFIPDYLSGRSELIKWFTTQYGDADTREREAETKVMLQDNRYGATEKDRQVALRKARDLSWTLNPISVVISLLAAFIPNAVSLLFLMCAMPWIAILLTWRSNGLIRISVRKGTPHPSLSFMMAFPAFILGVYTIARFRFYGFDGHAWMLTTLVTVAMLLPALLALRATIALEKYKVVIIVFLVVIAGFYSFGVAGASNCVLDRGAPQQMEATVYNKYIRRSRSTSYVLDLSSWGRYTNGNTITVSREIYNSTHQGDVIYMQVYPGKWGIPWYRLGNGHY